MEDDRTVSETHIDTAAHRAGGLLRSKLGLWALAGISFLESALVVPLVTDPFLVAYILADRRNTKKAVIVATITSILGGVVAYILAYAFYEFIAAQYLVGATGTQFHEIVADLQEGTFLFTLLGAVTPIPYTLVALAVGFLEGSLLLFVLASIIGRGARYVIVGYVTYRFGEGALSLARRNILLLTIAIICVAAIYFGFKYM